MAVWLFLALLAALVMTGAMEARQLAHPPNAAVLVARLPRAPLPGKGQRVLVFSPHPDDETLGVGGLIRQARDRGAEVWVVWYTDGDGFPLCAATEFHHPPDLATMRRLGTKRRAEAVAAVGALGVPADHTTFLGYPDRGLAALWTDHWTPADAYTSPFTGHFRVPPNGSFRGDAPYCGQSVLADVEVLLQRIRPDFVYFSDPADDHPDHWASHCFTRLALERLRGEPWAARLTASTYLIHRGSWPQPRGEQARLFLAPPAEVGTLAGVEWSAVELPATALAAKRAALRAHASQEALTGSFLGAFLRRNELLSHWPAGEAPEAIFPDLTQDRWGRARCPGVDFTSLAVRLEGAKIVLRLRARGSIVPWADYVVYWKPVEGSAASLGAREVRLSGYRCSSPGVRFRIFEDEIEVEVPRAELVDAQCGSGLTPRPPSLRGKGETTVPVRPTERGSLPSPRRRGAGGEAPTTTHLQGSSIRLMIGAEAWSGPVLLDRTPWRMVRLPLFSQGGGQTVRSMREHSGGGE